MKRIKLYIACSFVLLFCSAKAQPLELSLNRFQNLTNDKAFANLNSNVLTVCKPIIINATEYDSIQIKFQKDLNRKMPSKYSLFRKLGREHLIQVTKPDFKLNIDPVFDVFIMQQKTPKEKFYTNTRGLWVQGMLGTKFSFYTSFYETQSTFPNYIRTSVETSKVAPGMGRYKIFNITGFDYAMASGAFTATLNKFLVINAGHGKQFIGEGYRSLLLSDNAFNYPYFKTIFKSKYIGYTFCTASLQIINAPRNLNPGFTETIFTRKPFSFHLLTITPHKRIQISFYQSTMFQARDSGRYNKFVIDAYNPIIGISTLQYGLNNYKHNVLLGAITKIKITNSIFLYGQWLLDDKSAAKNSLRNKSGYQLGAKYYDAFGLRNLFLLAEFNSVRPYTYATENSRNSYTHYGQSLSSPLGANYKELVGILNYRFLKDLNIELKGNLIFTGADSANANLGKSPFVSTSTAYLGQDYAYNKLEGNRNIIALPEAKLMYQFNHTTGLSIWGGALARVEYKGGKFINMQFVTVGVRSNLYNLYHDF